MIKSESLEIQYRIEGLNLALNHIEHRGRTERRPVPYLHKDDFNFSNFLPDINHTINKQEKTSKLKLGIVVGTGSILSIAPHINVDAWLVLDNNEFVIEWLRLTSNIAKDASSISQYRNDVFSSTLAEEARNSRIKPEESLEWEMRALGESHFLASDENYRATCEVINGVPILYSLGDLSDSQYTQELSEAIEHNGAEIHYANLTDIYEFNEKSLGAISKLPFIKDVAISWATRAYSLQNLENHPYSQFTTGIYNYSEQAAQANNLFRLQWNNRFGR